MSTFNQGAKSVTTSFVVGMRANFSVKCLCVVLKNSFTSLVEAAKLLFESPTKRVESLSAERKNMDH